VASATQSQHAVNASQVQAQAVTAFPSAGAAPSFTLTPTPVLTAYSAGQRFRVKFNAAGSGNDTLNVSGLGAKSIKQYDASGAKVAAVIAAGQLADVEYDGVDFVILDPLPSAQLPGFRNRLINGAIQVDQRNYGAVQTFTSGAAIAYCADRWYGYCSGANVTGQQIVLANRQNRYRFTGAAGNTGVGFGQRIEAANCLDLAGGSATLQVKASSTSLASLTWTAYYANSADSFGSGQPEPDADSHRYIRYRSGRGNLYSGIEYPGCRDYRYRDRPDWRRIAGCADADNR
jgi:hypothetical protein